MRAVNNQTFLLRPKAPAATRRSNKHNNHHHNHSNDSTGNKSIGQVGISEYN